MENIEIKLVPIDDFIKLYDRNNQKDGNYLCRTISHSPLKYENFIQVRLSYNEEKNKKGIIKCFNLDCSNQDVTHISTLPITKERNF